MTACEVYELTTRGGASHLARLIAWCESRGPYCVVGDMAVNCYVEPIYTRDVDLVAGAFASPIPVPASDLRIQFTTDERYQAFLSRSVESEILGIRVRVACLEDVTQGKLWAYRDPRRRLSKREKDRLDLIRLGEAYPEIRPLLPAELRELIERG